MKLSGKDQISILTKTFLLLSLVLQTIAVIEILFSWNEMLRNHCFSRTRMVDQHKRSFYLLLNNILNVRGFEYYVLRDNVWKSYIEFLLWVYVSSNRFSSHEIDTFWNKKTASFSDFCKQKILFLGLASHAGNLSWKKTSRRNGWYLEYYGYSYVIYSSNNWTFLIEAKVLSIFIHARCI